MVEHENAHELKKLILALHDDEPFEKVKARFDALIGDISPERLAAIEQQLIEEGMPVEEVQRLCDLHVGVIRQGLRQGGKLDVPPGHPVHTYMTENREFEKLANQALEATRIDPSELHPATLASRLEALSVLDTHYLRKENQLFPYLERHGVTGPPQVMWGIHDDIRGKLRALRERLMAGETGEIADDLAALAQAITEMIYKEEAILFPLAMETLSSDEWVEMRRGEDAIGYAFGTPPAWPEEGGATPSSREARGRTIPLSTGGLTIEQLDRMLVNLPVDLTFVDADDRVAFYSDAPDRIFPRTPAVVGRQVAHCHPPSSVDKVLAILDAFKAGTQHHARFWIEMGGRFILIEYFAVRNGAGDYLGCLEASQDITELRKLEGERRLLDWGD